MHKLIDDFSFGLFFWQAIILLVLILLLVKYAWKPIMNTLTQREESIKNSLQLAEQAKIEMQNLQASNEKLLAEARAEREILVKEGRDMKKQIIEDARVKAQEQTDKMVEAAKDAITKEKAAVLFDMKNQIASLALEISEKVLKNELNNKDTQSKLVESLLAETKLN
ncbi:MAG: F0F1 ATP synthase subunit B [Flavobacterium sp.]|jgi:F-type H+-transporting ATPase subunit b